MLHHLTIGRIGTYNNEKHMPVFLCTQDTHMRTHAHYICKNDMHTRTHTILHTVTITLTPHASKYVLYVWHREPTEEELSGANKTQKQSADH